MFQNDTNSDSSFAPFESFNALMLIGSHCFPGATSLMTTNSNQKLSYKNAFRSIYFCEWFVFVCARLPLFRVCVCVCVFLALWKHLFPHSVDTLWFLWARAKKRKLYSIISTCYIVGIIVDSRTTHIVSPVRFVCGQHTVLFVRKSASVGHAVFLDKDTQNIQFYLEPHWVKWTTKWFNLDFFSTIVWTVFWFKNRLRILNCLWGIHHLCEPNDYRVIYNPKREKVTWHWLNIDKTVHIFERHFEQCSCQTIWKLLSLREKSVLVQRRFMVFTCWQLCLYYAPPVNCWIFLLVCWFPVIFH